MFYIIFIKALVAFTQIPRQRFAIPTASVGNMTLPGFSPSFSPVVQIQFNKDLCPFTWPIQRHNLFPATTLNDVAATLMFLEPAPVKPVPENTCPPLLPIQRFNLAPVTNINDIASVVAEHYAKLEQPAIDDPDQLILGPILDADNHTDSKTFFSIPAVYIISLVPILLVMAATISLVLRHKCIRSLTSLEQHFELLGRQQRERSREAQLEKAHAMLASQDELIRSLQSQLQLSQSGEKRSTIKAKRLEAINSSQHTEIGRLRMQRNNVAVPPTFISNFSRPITPTSSLTNSIRSPLTPSPSSSVSTSNECTTSLLNHSSLVYANDNVNLDGFPAAADVTVEQTTTTPSSTPIALLINNSEGSGTPALPTANTNDSTGEEDQASSPKDEDGSWIVVQRRKKRSRCAECSSV